MKATKYNLGRGDYVKIDHGRGYGDLPFKITKTDSQHFWLTNTIHKEVQIYKALCYIDADTIRLCTELKRQTATRIAPARKRHTAII